MTAEIPMILAEDVSDAVAEGRAVVALESTIITHGLPAPRNVETARLLEDTVRGGGATPATIAILDGVIRVGLDDDGLQRLAAAESVLKLSRADLALAIASGATGSTTVAATMIVARLAGIETFATGGIGGVHRGAEGTFDISADLPELASTAVTVVAAGAKAILDLPKTLEVLETHGVPVIGYRTDAFPAFWSRDSGLAVPTRLDSSEAIARAFRMRGALGLAGGQLVVNPIPEGAEIPLDEITPHIEQALAAAERAGITGKAVTPFLLAHVLEGTSGRSLDANVALVVNNARLATKIALAKSARRRA